MVIGYTSHARQRMALRSISEDDIALVLSDPDITFTDRKGNPVYRRYVDGRRITVVVARFSTPPLVITVYL